ncbi:MAG: N-6 DNA methylase [Patescibacteria group bacterium]
MAKDNSTANLGFEKKLWEAADKMRNNMDPSQYKHVVLGLIFLKYISDSFQQTYQDIREDKEAGEWELNDRDAYKARHTFWVPEEARWDYIKSKAKDPEIGKIIDDALLAIEKENDSLKGVFEKRYSRATLDKTLLGELVDLISGINLKESKDGGQDVFGRIYEYFIGKFADAEGKHGGQYFTPNCIVRLLAKMIEPYKGRVYDPCCGSGGMFVQSKKFVEGHGGKVGDISIYGQESNSTTWRLCKMNLAIRGIEGDLGGEPGNSFHNDLHPDLKADYILANPPFNVSDWGGEKLRDDVRWKYGVPPTGNANYAWIQHFVHHLAPHGTTGFVMANGSLASQTSNEGEIRKAIIKDHLVDCIVAMPDKLFYNVAIPCTLWFLSRHKQGNDDRERRNEILFIDARDMGEMIDRRHRELTGEDTDKIANTYHEWRKKDGKYEDIKGFCKSATLEEVEKNNYVLTPGRYVGIEIDMLDDEEFEEKMTRLTSKLSQQFQESKKLEEKIKENLKKVGFEI